MLILGVEDVENLDTVFRLLKHFKNFILTGNILASLRGSLQSNLAVSVMIEGLEDIAYRMRVETYRMSLIQELS